MKDIEIPKTDQDVYDYIDSRFSDELQRKALRGIYDTHRQEKDVITAFVELLIEINKLMMRIS